MRIRTWLGVLGLASLASLACNGREVVLVPSGHGPPDFGTAGASGQTADGGDAAAGAEGSPDGATGDAPDGKPADAADGKADSATDALAGDGPKGDAAADAPKTDAASDLVPDISLGTLDGALDLIKL